MTLTFELTKTESTDVEIDRNVNGRNLKTAPHCVGVQQAYSTCTDAV